MKQTELEQLVFRFFSKIIRRKELDELSNAIQDNDHDKIFREYVRINYLATYNVCDFKTKEEKEKLLKAIEELNKTRPLFKKPCVQIWYCSNNNNICIMPGMEIKKYN